MVFLVHLLQPFPGDMGIDLGRRDVGVAQHGLDRPQVRTVVQQVGGKGMA